MAISFAYNAVLSFLLPSLKLPVDSFLVSSCCSRRGGIIKVSVHASCFPESKAGRRPCTVVQPELCSEPQVQGWRSLLCLGLPFRCSIWPASENLGLLFYFIFNKDRRIYNCSASDEEKSLSLPPSRHPLSFPRPSSLSLRVH